MSNKLKKKGSSLVVITVVMAILFTTSTAILTLVTSDYKMRINESRRIENMYKADSGLDVVYNVIVKNSEAAILKASKEVTKKYKDSTEDISSLYEKMNKDFKEEFIKFLGKSAANKGENKNTDALLAQGIVNNKYMIFSEDTDSFDWKNYERNADVAANPVIEILDYEYRDTSIEEGKGEIRIKVKSTFESLTGEFKNTKTISTEFVIKTPDYEGSLVASTNTENIEIQPVFDGKAITADGNMNVTGNVSIKGDIWIKGNQENIENPNYVFDKYRGGVVVDNSTLNIDGNIYTANTLQLKNNTNVTVTNDIYALNTYVGKDNTDATSSNNILNVNKNLVVNNDLALNATESSINIDTNFYGINDKTTVADTAEKAMKSSSIIVNEIGLKEDNTPTSSITVNGDSYIMGVAYINATDNEGNKYQTGESVAVKGNYLAYTDILAEYEDNVTMKYYNPLQLIEFIDGDDTLKNKAEYIKEYYAANSSELKTGGVNLKGNVSSVGAYIDKAGKVQYDNSWSGDAVIDGIRSEFARNVFAMGNTNGVDSDKDNSELYSAGQVVNTVSNQVDFSKIVEGITLNEKYGQVYLDNTASEVTIIDNKIGNKEIKEGVIIVKNNINIEDDFDFKGIIIAGGDVEFKNTVSNTVKIEYDENIVRKVIASNYDVLKNIFIGSKINDAEVNVGELINVETTTNGYEVDSYLSTNNWKILK